MIIKNNQRDLGIELLRVVLCFWIVLVHCLSKSKLLNIVGRNDYHVPCFIVISFYFFYNALCKKNISKIRIRFIRLLIPFWIWPIIIWLFNNIFKYYYSSNRLNRFLSFNDLEIQLLVGRKFHRQLWFLFNLLIFNLFFLIISFLLKNNFYFYFNY
jgi:fucose 4-O-acetylase-like acetyltransferase